MKVCIRVDKIVLVGGGGHCKVIIEILQLLKSYKIAGVCDNVCGSVLGVPILGNDDILSDLHDSGIKNAFIAMGAIGNADKRRDIATKLLEYGFILPNIIHPTAVVSPTAVFGFGNFIGPNVVVNSSSKIGNCCIVNTAAIVEHDCQIGDFVHIAPMATICGGAVISDCVHIGPNATVLEYKKVANHAMVGAGSIVTKDIKEAHTTGYGIPFKEVIRGG